MDETLPLLIDYVNKAADLAESVKSDLKKNNKISNKTILALNDFIMAAHNIEGLTIQLDKYNMKYN
jgi:hypothetical protein